MFTIKYDCVAQLDNQKWAFVELNIFVIYHITIIYTRMSVIIYYLNSHWWSEETDLSLQNT